MNSRPFYKIYLNKKILHILALVFFAIYGPLAYIFYTHLIQKGLFIQELSKEPVVWTILIVVHIFVFGLYFCFIKQIFVSGPIIELYESKIRLNPIFTLKSKDIPISKIIEISYMENTFSQRGRFRVTIATRNTVKNMRKDTKSYHASMTRFKTHITKFATKYKNTISKLQKTEKNTSETLSKLYLAALHKNN